MQARKIIEQMQQHEQPVMQQKQQIMIKSLAAVCLSVEATAADVESLCVSHGGHCIRGHTGLFVGGRFLVGAPGGTVMHQQLANELRW